MFDLLEVLIAIQSELDDFEAMADREGLTDPTQIEAIKDLIIEAFDWTREEYDILSGKLFEG